MQANSLLDLSPFTEGSGAGRALWNCRSLARHADDSGYHRFWGYHSFWMGEHHNMPGVANAAPAVALGYVAGCFSRARYSPLRLWYAAP